MSNDIILKVQTDYVKEDNGGISSDYPIQIDYGDGTPLETYNGIIEHTYNEFGEYIIRIKRVQSIGDNFLYKSDLAYSVTEAIIPHQITTIGDNFCLCPSMTRILLPNSLVSVGDFFIGSNERIGEGDPYEYGMRRDGCEALESIDLPSTLTSIGRYFLRGAGIRELRIPESIMEIPDNFCNECGDLRNIIFPKSLKSIGNSFYEDSKGHNFLEQITIPKNVEEIGLNFFITSHYYYMKYGEVTFNGEYPPTIQEDLSEFYSMSPVSMKIHIPQGLLGDYESKPNYPVSNGETYENPYVEYSTLKGSLQKLGSRIRNNLQTKGVSSNSNEGLTTLANKIQDIETNNMTGFLADIGFYDQDSWSGTPPTILKDKIIFTGNAEFPFNNVVFPDTFTWSFILTTHDKGDELTEPITIGQYHSLNFEESVDMEFCIRITRENGGDFIIKCDETGDESSFNSLSSKSLLITPYGAKPVTISEIYFSEEYDDYPYSIISYNLCWDNSFHTKSTDIWDNDSDTKPTSVPLLLLKNGTPFKSYSLTEATDDLIFRGISLVPVNPANHCWGNYHYIFSSDMSNYSWKTIKDIGCQLEFKDNREDLYSPIKHLKKGISVDESSRLDNYFHNLLLIGYDEVNLQDYDILPWGDEHFDYQIVRKMAYNLSYPELFFTFEYIRLDETNNDVGIFIDYIGPSANGSLLFYISNDMFTILNNDNAICSSEKLAFQDYKVFQDYNIITIRQTQSEDYTLVWDIELNGNSVLSYNSNISRQYMYTLQRQCYQNNAKISNFYYGSLKEV